MKHLLTALLITVVLQSSLLAQKKEWAIAPIPIVEPVTEEGVGLALEYRYPVGVQSIRASPSATAFGGFVTTNRSFGVGAAQRLYFKNDLWRARVAGSYVDIRYNFYGIGTEAGDRGVSVLNDQEGIGALGELLYRFADRWYGGLQYRLVDTTSTFRPNPAFDTSIVSPDELDVRTASLGPRVTRDSRDDVNYPTSGSLFDLHFGFNGAAVGSQLNYQTYDVAYSKYMSIRPRQVLAVRGSTCFARGDVPFFDLCLVSASQNLRGYRASRYRDRTMLASQAEYRWEAWKRLGFVGFAGAGEIGSNLGDFNTHNVLPGGGLGVRYRITRERHVNVRFDFAWGKHSHEAYFFIGEAF